ncbi:MAG: hypothetical protein ACEY3L_17070, partial [Wolbachia sp.]
EDNKITYIEDGQVKYTTVNCESNLRSNKPGAGGCIDKNKEVHDENSPRYMQKGIYGKGSPGYVKIRPIIKEFDEEEINAVIKKIIEDQYDFETMTDFWIGDLNVNRREIIEEEVKKELLR